MKKIIATQEINGNDKCKVNCSKETFKEQFKRKSERVAKDLKNGDLENCVSELDLLRENTERNYSLKKPCCFTAGVVAGGVVSLICDNYIEQLQSNFFDSGVGVAVVAGCFMPLVACFVKEYKYNKVIDDLQKKVIKELENKCEEKERLIRISDVAKRSENEQIMGR